MTTITQNHQNSLIKFFNQTRGSWKVSWHMAVGYSSGGSYADWALTSSLLLTASSLASTPMTPALTSVPSLTSRTATTPLIAWLVLWFLWRRSRCHARSCCLIWIHCRILYPNLCPQNQRFDLANEINKAKTMIRRDPISIQQDSFVWTFPLSSQESLLKACRHAAVDWNRRLQ